MGGHQPMGVVPETREADNGVTLIHADTSFAADFMIDDTWYVASWKRIPMGHTAMGQMRGQAATTVTLKGSEIIIEGAFTAVNKAQAWDKKTTPWTGYEGLELMEFRHKAVVGTSRNPLGRPLKHNSFLDPKK